MIRSWPASKTFDTLHACDMASKEFLTFEELKHEYRRYLMGDYAPHYLVPAIRLEVESYVYDLTIVNVHTGLDVAWFYRS